MIGVVCALKSEADCFIKHFELKIFSEQSLFPIYTNGQIFLIISGIGKTHAAASLSYLYAVTGEKPHTAWVNIGVGGHPSREVGEGVLAHQVIDEGNMRTFYPTLSWKSTIPTETIFTVDQVEQTFSRVGVYEMEAAGFCSSAFKVTSSELIHCYKVISDNRKTLPTQDHHSVRTLIASHLDPISDLIAQILGLQKELSDWTSVSEILLPFTKRWRFTTTQLYQLQRYLQRWEALSNQMLVVDHQLMSCKKAKEVLACLDQRLKGCSL